MRKSIEIYLQDDELVCNEEDAELVFDGDWVILRYHDEHGQFHEHTIYGKNVKYTHEVTFG